MTKGRAYISNISGAWPVERQEQLLKGFTDIYRDELTKAQIKRRRTDELADRRRMLRPSSRDQPDRISIAAWPCFAWDTEDLLVALGHAAEKHVTIVCLSDGIEVEPFQGMPNLGRVVEAFRNAKRGARTEPGRQKGTDVAAERRRADVARRIALIADDWPKREHTTKELLLRAGTNPKTPMAYATAMKFLKARPKVQRAYEVKNERAAHRKALRDEE